MLKGWKATKTHHNINYSVVAGGKHQLRYDFDVPTKRPENAGPLALFATEENAKNLFGFSITTGYAIHPCEYTPSKDTQLWHPYTTPAPGPLPAGTIFAEDITLLHQETP